MAFATLSAHNFAATGDMEAALYPFMGFDFRHPRIPFLSLPSLQFFGQLAVTEL